MIDDVLDVAGIESLVFEQCLRNEFDRILVLSEDAICFGVGLVNELGSKLLLLGLILLVEDGDNLCKIVI